MKAAYRYFLNAAIYYDDKKNFSKASSSFEIYCALATSPLLPKNTISKKDGAYQASIYYSIACAIKSKDSSNAIKLLNRAINETYYTNDTYQESDFYELLAEEYKKIGNFEDYQKTLKIGADKFPRNEYFAPNIINKL